MSLIKELQRRNVIRVATAYVVAAWLIVQVAETTFEAFGFGSDSLRLVIIVLAIGFLPAVIAAWVFEWTPDGLKLDKESDVSAPGNVKTSRLLDRAIIVGLTLAVGLFAYDKFVLDPERDEAREQVVAEEARSDAVKGFYGERSIAVLPFVNMSSNPEQEYFAKGISEEVLNLLAKIRELRVISRSSAFSSKLKDLEISEVARRLDVAHILEGSVRKSGNQVRVTAQLIDARTDTHLWSQTYDRELVNVFAIQDEIATDVATNLEITLLSPLPKSRAIDPEVRSLTAQANQIQEMRPENTGRKMELLLNRALAIDPDYVPALELMTYAVYFLEREGQIDVAEEEYRYQQINARILALEPDSGFVDSTTAFDVGYVEGDLENAASLFTSSVAKDPADSNIVRLAGVFARHIGRQDIAVRLLEHQVAIDPLCFQCLYQLARSYMYAGAFEKAEMARSRYLAISEGPFYHSALIKLLQGDAAAALTIVEDKPDDHPQVLAIRAMANYDLGRFTEAEIAYEQLLALPEERNEVHFESSAWMNKKDQAFAFLREAAENDPIRARGGIFSPALGNLHDDPRWTEFRESIGMSEERLNAIDFSPQLPQ
jgi:TolB-like protein/tetratricopeptide (TPR) repeat protein